MTFGFYLNHDNTFACGIAFRWFVWLHYS